MCGYQFSAMGLAVAPWLCVWPCARRERAGSSGAGSTVTPTLRVWLAPPWMTPRMGETSPKSRPGGQGHVVLAGRTPAGAAVGGVQSRTSGAPAGRSGTYTAAQACEASLPPAAARCRAPAGQQVAADIPGGQAQAAQAGHQDVGKVLAHAGALRQGLQRRGVDLGALALGRRKSARACAPSARWPPPAGPVRAQSWVGHSRQRRRRAVRRAMANTNSAAASKSAGRAVAQTARARSPSAISDAGALLAWVPTTLRATMLQHAVRRLQGKKATGVAIHVSRATGWPVSGLIVELVAQQLLLRGCSAAAGRPCAGPSPPLAGSRSGCSWVTCSFMACPALRSCSPAWVK